MKFLKKIAFISIAAAVLTSSVSFAAEPTDMNSSDHNQTISLIQKLTQNQAIVSKQFDAIDGYKGYVIEPKTGGQKQIIFSDPSGNLILGTIITPEGKNISEEYNQKYVVAPTAKTAFEKAAQTNYITEGTDKAKHKMYIIFDPNCAYCHLLYKELSQSKLIDNGTLQIRWIPVGFIKQDSTAKSAGILSAKDKARALKNDELNFDLKMESGGATPLKQTAENQIFFDQVKSNNEYALSNGFNVTPILIYKTTDSAYTYTPGYVNNEQFKNLMTSVSDSWN
ncbi:thiol:disulfide interchange protein DsbG [Thiotrichales bacterium 19S9-12]|nr:thiol:disulfide interchange protein DsbG [Thiotrichales bacterium 19S9-11]MCF6810763.1 thiol:disulfide interchange protein DsbG [Thiotrichales bacterium 19S9-12]